MVYLLKTSDTYFLVDNKKHNYPLQTIKDNLFTVN